MFQSIILSILIFLPLVGAIVVLLLPRQQLAVVRWTALGFACLNLLMALILMLLYSQFTVGVLNIISPFTENISWITALGINYSLSVDGISLLLVVLTALLTAVCIAASFGIEQKVKNYMAFMLFFECGMLGVFLASNLFLFYIFWEIMLIPAYFLVGSWGGPRRIYAVFKFVLYTSAGSLLMLAGIIALGYYHQAFAVKVPFVPFHSWLPDAYSEAPVPVTAMLAGAMSKTGAYGFLRYCIPLFPQAAQTFAPYISILAVVGILYCAVLALVQTDLKRLLGYSSISHLGVIMLGMFAFNQQGVEGSVLQMVNHGITIAALFLISGLVEQRTGTRRINELGGLAVRLPVLATVMLIASLSSLGLPGLNSFTGEFLAFLGAFRSNVTLGVLATAVVVPAAWYMVRFFQGVMQGVLPSSGPAAVALRKSALSDMTIGEFVTLLPLLALIFYIGLQPAPLTFLLHQSVINTMQNLGNLFPTCTHSAITALECREGSVTRNIR